MLLRGSSYVQHRGRALAVEVLDQERRERAEALRVQLYRILDKAVVFR